MMDIRLYPIMGYNKELDEFVTMGRMKAIREMDSTYIRERVYTYMDTRRLANFDALAKQITGKRFGFFCDGGSVLSGNITGFSWNEHRTIMNLHLQLDIEPEASIEYSVCRDSRFSIGGGVVVIVDEGDLLPLNQTIPTNSLKVTL